MCLVNHVKIFPETQTSSGAKLFLGTRPYNMAASQVSRLLVIVKAGHFMDTIPTMSLVGGSYHHLLIYVRKEGLPDKSKPFQSIQHYGRKFLNRNSLL
jgi:hypothetical protein